MPLRRQNVPFLLLAALALLAGLWAGLIRLPWALPPLRPALSMAHGPLMIGGFLGALISLERAVGLTALDRRYRWTYVAPAAAGVGGLLLVLGVSGLPGPVLVTLGSAVLLATMLAVVRLQPLLHTSFLSFSPFIRLCPL